MEFSQIWGFMKILSESIKICLKNVKLIASITTLSLLLSSILFLLLSFSFHSADTYMTNSITSGSIPIPQIIIFAVEITFFFSYIAIVTSAGVATVITTAASYTNTKLSLPDLFSAVETKWKTTPFWTKLASLDLSSNPLNFLFFVAAAVAAAVAVVILVILYPNPATITITIVSVGGVAITVNKLYALVIPALAAVILVLEDGCKAAEKAEKLVEGQRIHGFVVNLFINIVGLIVCMGFWMMVGDQGRFSFTVYGLFIVDCALLARIFLSVVYTVYYFRCKEYHGHQILPFRSSNYTKLIRPSTTGASIPARTAPPPSSSSSSNRAAAMLFFL